MTRPAACIASWQRRYPTSRFAPTSRFRAAMIALLSGQPKLAAEEFDALAERYRGSDEASGRRTGPAAHGPSG